MPINLTGGEYSLSTSADLVSFTPPQGSGLSSTNLQEAVVEVNSDISSTINTSILNLIYPIGSIYMSVNNTNPGTYLTGTTWVAWGAGRVPVGVDTSQTEFDNVEETGGSKTVTLTSAQSGVPAHSHSIPALSGSASSKTLSGTISLHGGTVSNVGNIIEAASGIASGEGGATNKYRTPVDLTERSGASSKGVIKINATHDHTVTTTADTSGNNTATDATTAHTNLQPYITCYMWKRTA